MSHGYLLLVLHAHLPYVRHPDNDDFLEEDWLFEAITETYIPVLHNLQQALEAGVNPRLTMTWSPPLCEMLADPLLQQRYRHHVERLLGLAEQEVPAKQHTPFAEAAVMYRDHYRFCLQTLDRCDGQLLRWVRELMDAGALEAITCGATHGFLPLMRCREAQRAQITVAANNYRKHFGRDPKGIWLPECGYVPGIDELLAEQGIRYFFVETHGIYFGDPRPRYGVYRPVYTPSGVAAFGRDPESSRSVWSAEIGYPGNPRYREFYRDLGYDGEYDYVKNCLHKDGVRRNIGLKYHRVTGKVPLHEKEAYVPSHAFRQAMEDAGNFVFNRVQQIRYLGELLDTEPVIVAPYDAELFGHWWFEGPQFIQSIFHTAAQSPEITVVNGSEFLERCSIHQISTPSASSWGDNGYNGVWLNPGNDWIYRHLHMSEQRMVECARRFPAAEGDLRRALNQMARELLLMQSSDWAFIMTTQTTVPYAVRRTRDHVNRFTALYEAVIGDRLDMASVATIEWFDPIFQEIDYRVYS
jgi:1,4-alpha-glucan branching enzyme